MLPICRKTAQRGFTLIEVMIVVCITGILFAIAAPNFAKARTSSRAKTCISNLQQIDSAKRQWAMDKRKGNTDIPTASDLYGADKFIKDVPQCPSLGTYTLGNVATSPTCSVSAAPDNHRL